MLSVQVSGGAAAAIGTAGAGRAVEARDLARGRREPDRASGVHRGPGHALPARPPALVDRDRGPRGPVPRPRRGASGGSRRSVGRPGGFSSAGRPSSGLGSVAGWAARDCERCRLGRAGRAVAHATTAHGAADGTAAAHLRLLNTGMWRLESDRACRGGLRSASRQDAEAKHRGCGRRKDEFHHSCSPCQPVRPTGAQGPGRGIVPIGTERKSGRGP
jgi:hypothetical protein